MQCCACFAGVDLSVGEIDSAGGVPVFGILACFAKDLRFVHGVAEFKTQALPTVKVGCDVYGSARAFGLAHAEVLCEWRVVAFDGTALDLVDVDFIGGTVNGDGAAQTTFIAAFGRFPNPVRAIRTSVVDDVPFDERVLRPAVNADVGVSHVGVA